MKINTSKVALVGFALMTAFVVILFAVLANDSGSSAIPSGPTTPPPATTPSSSASGASAPSAEPTPPSASSADPTTRPPAKMKATAVPSRVVGVRPRLENVGFSGSGDISDDAAIWVDSANPERSLVIANNKDEDGGGVGVFDMEGNLVQFLRSGEIGNVDLRTGFSNGEGSVVLVGANNRSTNTLELWTLNTKSRRLSKVDGRTIRTTASNYGFCLYHSKASDKFYAFVTPEDEGSIQQFELLPRASGVIDAKVVRTLPISGKTEACVADDDEGKLYVGQEERAIWKYGAEPRSATDRVSVDTVNGHLEADIEGMSIAYGADGSGFLIVSSQGDSTIAVYGRQDDNPFIKRVKIVGKGTIDGVTGTDGLDVTAQNAGPGFTDGLLVVHDESNSGGRTSNLKYVSLGAVLEAS